MFFNNLQVGIEIYINKVMVARSSLPAKQRDGTFDFTERSDCSVDGDPPPVVTLGCAYNRSVNAIFFLFFMSPRNIEF